ncbi:hypothetical protein [Methylobacterium fujisawaense]|uniref:hypothetical protein n=1 Tax=Methylobacterium fujisawaense TaxID=107400 RepID=UPI00244AC8E3|nr:hypothetical protein [Methylobacterium fujisawaense]MDH3031076.1 hypothetical protein [Methylobacterium fujisawaense]
MNARNQHFGQIQDGWLPLERALYAFAPNYLSDGRKRQNALRAEAAEFFAIHKIKPEYDNWGVDIHATFLGVSFTIQDDHFFTASDHGEDNADDEAWNDPIFYASGSSIDEFCGHLTKSSSNQKYAKAAQTCALLAQHLSRMYHEGFFQAVQSGSAVIYARARSPLSPFTRIFPDQWRHFRIVDAEAGTAEGPIGEQLFCCHVQPNETCENAAELTAGASQGAGNIARAAAINACKIWIVGLIKASPDQRTHSNTQLRDEALKRWGDRLSGRGFETAYRDARREAPAPAWAKTGPRTGVRN